MLNYGDYLISQLFDQMTLHRAYFPFPILKDARVGDVIELPSDVEHRLVRVLRLDASDTVELFDNYGTVVLGHLDKTKSGFRIDEIRMNEKKRRTLTLVQSLVKQDKLEEIVQRNCEIGVDRFIIFLAERSVVKITERTSAQIERLSRIAQDASRQCERNDVPRIEGPVSLSSLKGSIDFKRALTFTGNPRDGRPLLEALQSTDLSETEEIVLIVGPEGGLTEKEEKAFASLGAISVCYARHVLRTETAGIVGASIIQGFL